MGKEFRGELRPLTVTAELVFVPVYGSKGSLAPSHVVVANGVEVGVAAPAGPEAGAGLRVRIDDPTFPAPLVGTLKCVENDEFVLTWRRPVGADEGKPRDDKIVMLRNHYRKIQVVSHFP